MPYTVEANAVAVPVRTYLNECVVAGRFLHYCRECGNCQYREGRTFFFSSNKAWERYPCRSMRKGWNSAALFRYRPMYMLGRTCGDASPFGERR